MTAIRLRSLRGLVRWTGIVLTLPAVLVAGTLNQCKLRPGLYHERKALDAEYASQVGNNYTGHQELAERLTRKINEVDAEYYRFVYTLAGFAADGDTASLATCRIAAQRDPVARQLAALVLYLHGGRKDPGAFIASLPRTKVRLAAFWTLDAIVAHGEAKEPTSLPGIPLPDGLIDRYTTELFVLVEDGSPAAIKEYFCLYSNSDGEYREFMQDQVTRLFKGHPELILQKWTLFRPYGEMLVASEDVSREDYREIRARFTALCEKRKGRSCTEILKLLH